MSQFYSKPFMKPGRLSPDVLRGSSCATYQQARR